MLVGRHDHTATRTRLDIDMRVDAALADEAQRAKAFEQRRADLRALADQHQHLRIPEALCERVDILRVVVPDRYVVPVELAKARERAQRIEIIIQDRNLHSGLDVVTRYRCTTSPSSATSVENAAVGPNDPGGPDIIHVGPVGSFELRRWGDQPWSYP